jgi:hypothetical protein
LLPHLNNLDISGFDPKAPPPKTPAFWDIVNANIAPEDAEIADAIDALGNPDARRGDRRGGGAFEQQVSQGSAAPP